MTNRVLVGLALLVAGIVVGTAGVLAEASHQVGPADTWELEWFGAKTIVKVVAMVVGIVAAAIGTIIVTRSHGPAGDRAAEEPDAVRSRAVDSPGR